MDRPELLGVLVVGGTIGAVCAGAMVGAPQAHIVLGTTAGAVLMPAIVAAPWSRLRRSSPPAAPRELNAG